MKKIFLAFVLFGIAISFGGTLEIALDKMDIMDNLLVPDNYWVMPTINILLGIMSITFGFVGQAAIQKGEMRDMKSPCPRFLKRRKRLRKALT